MNKKLLLGIILLVVIILTITLLVIFRDTSSKQLELTYETNGGVPYKWEYVIADEDIVTFVKSYVVKDENKGGMVGAPIHTNYVFKGLKEGVTTITFRYVSITDGEITKEEKNTIKVDKDNNVSLVTYTDK